MSLAPTRRSAGFTLVELLVVIGIIALLISILLPALNKARESARQVKCMSNMQQIAKAVMMFAGESKGRMPTAQGTGAPQYLNVSGNYASVDKALKDTLQSTTEWIAWRRMTDPITGLPPSDPSQGLDMNITYSALTKFLGSKMVDTYGNYGEAHTASRTLDEVFRCPSDNLEARPKITDRGAYRYSYSYNQMWTGNRTSGSNANRGEACANGVTTEFSKFTGRINSIKKSGEKILIICEDEQTLDDNVWTHNSFTYNATENWVAGTTIGAVASRHENRRKNANSGSAFSNNNVGLQDARGNVAFCDGHVEFFSRKNALAQRHSGNPQPDHPDFYATKR